jgi:hypothetical protein
MPQHALIWLFLAGPLVAAPQDSTCKAIPETGSNHPPGRDSTIRVLFLGNSHTYVNQLPCLVQRLAASRAPEVRLEVVAVASDGATLEHHWADPSIRGLVQSRSWKFLILQEQGRQPLDHPERTRAAVRRFADAVRGTGARLVLYMPPVGRDRPSDLRRVAPVYQRIAVETGSAIAPAALAWEAVGRVDSTIDLYDLDGIHANSTGSYLTACVLLAAITGRSPQGVAPVVMRHPYGSPPATQSALDTLERATAMTLQAAAWTSVRDER